LLERKLVPMLDATPAGRTVYVGLGFQDCWTMERLIARTVRKAAAEPNTMTVRPLDARDWPQIVADDTAAFGADRSVLLRRLAGRLPEAALVAERGGRIVGFLLGRDGRVMSQLGPLVADDDGVARALLTQAIAKVSAPLVVDVPDHHAALRRWLATLGFAVERPYIRMAYGTSATLNDGARLFAIAGPELG